MAKKKLKMTDTKVRAVVVGAILLAFILALYFIFREPDNIKCPKGQVPQNGKCVPAPCSTIAQQKLNYFCTSENKCDRLKVPGQCRDCNAGEVFVIPSYVTTGQSGKLFDKPENKPLFGFGSTGPDDGKECKKTCNTNNDCDTKAGEACGPAYFGNHGNYSAPDPPPKVCTDKAKWACFEDESSCPDLPVMTTGEDGNQTFEYCKLSRSTTGICKQVPASFVDGTSSETLGLCQQKCKCADPYRLNADNNTCNTLPCTKDALGGWGADIGKGDKSEASTLFEYKAPDQKLDTTSPVGHCLAVNEKDGTLLRWADTSCRGLAEGSCNSKSDCSWNAGASMCESKCNAAKSELNCIANNEQYHKCKWFPAGTCVRVAPKDKDGNALQVKDTGDTTINKWNCDGICAINSPKYGLPFAANAANAPPGFEVNCGHYRTTFVDKLYPKIKDVATEVSNCTFKIDAKYDPNSEYNYGKLGEVVDGTKPFILVNVPPPPKTGTSPYFNMDGDYIQYNWDNFMSGKNNLYYINLCGSCGTDGTVVTVGNQYIKGIKGNADIIATVHDTKTQPKKIETNTMYRLGTLGTDKTKKNYFQMCDGSPVACVSCTNTSSYQNTRATTSGYYFQKIDGTKKKNLNRDTTTKTPLQYGDVVNIMTGTPGTPGTPEKAESCIVGCGLSDCGVVSPQFVSEFVVKASGSPESYHDQSVVYWAIISPKMFLENRKRSVCPASYSQDGQLVETSFNPLEYRRCNNGLSDNKDNNYSGTMFPELSGKTLAQSTTLLAKDNDIDKVKSGQPGGNYCYTDGSFGSNCSTGDTKCGFGGGDWGKTTTTTEILPQADYFVCDSATDDDSKYWCDIAGSTDWRGDLTPTIVKKGNFGAGGGGGFKDYSTHREDKTLCYQ